MAHITVDRDQFVKRCEEIYEKNRKNLEKAHQGKVVALYEGGVAGIGDNVDAAYEAAIKEYPDKIFYFRRVGKFSAVEYVFGYY